MTQPSPNPVRSGAEADRPRHHAASYRVRFDEATERGHLRGSALLGYLQDVAWRHSVALHFPRPWYTERGLAWVVRAIDLVLVGPAADGDDVTVDTRVAGWRRVLARRASSVRSGDGTLLARALVDWAMTDGRTVVRIPEDFAVFPSTQEGAFVPTRVAVPAAPSSACVLRFAVRRRELDPMGHTNNGVYLDWLDETVAAAGGEADVVDFPRRYRLEYLRPAPPGAVVASAAWPADGGWMYRLTGPDGEELLRGRLEPRAAAADAAAAAGAAADEDLAADADENAAAAAAAGAADAGVTAAGADEDVAGFRVQGGGDAP